MILTCPACSASYNVPAEAIGAEGRTVRCKKCKHEWFQKGEKRALEDLINLIESTDIEVDDIAFDDGKKKVSPPPVKKEKIPLKQQLRPVATAFQKLIPLKLKNYLFSGPKRSFLSHFASFMVAMALFSLLLLALVSFRGGITSVMPSLAPVYEAAGFPLTNYARLNPEESLTIDRIALVGEGDKREITGNLINLTSQNIKVPTFKLEYLDETGKVIQEGQAHLPVKIVQKEQAFAFNIAVSPDAPKNFTSVKVSFIE